VLGIVTRFAPDHWCGLARYRRAVTAHALAIAFHIELLQIDRKVRQAVVIGQRGQRGSFRKWMFQTPINPIRAGRLRCHGAERKCSSIAAPPARNSRKCRVPVAMASETPIEDHRG
jgi:hypothetical protein